jgi:hypothetical protein
VGPRIQPQQLLQQEHQLQQQQLGLIQLLQHLTCLHLFRCEFKSPVCWKDGTEEPLSWVLGLSALQQLRIHSVQYSSCWDTLSPVTIPAQGLPDLSQLTCLQLHGGLTGGHVAVIDKLSKLQDLHLGHAADLHNQQWQLPNLSKLSLSDCSCRQMASAASHHSCLGSKPCTWQGCVCSRGRVCRR